MLSLSLNKIISNTFLKVTSLRAIFFSILFSIVAINIIPYSRDYKNYIELFLSAKNAKSYFDSIESSEIVFSSLAFITKNFILSVLILSLIGMYIKFKLFLYFKTVSWVIICYYLARFFFVLDITQLRISFGISMLVVAYYYCVKRSSLKAFVFFLIALLSHSTTIIYMPILIFSALVTKPEMVFKKSIKFLILLFLSFLLIGLIIEIPFFSFINLPFDFFINNIPDKRIATYFLEEYEFAIPPLKTDYFFYFKIASLLFLSFSVTKNRYEYNNILNNTYRAGIVFVFSIFLFIIFHDLYAIASRLSDIAAPFECIVVGYFLANVTNFIRNRNLSFMIQLILSIIIIIKLLLSQKYLFSD